MTGRGRIQFASMMVAVTVVAGVLLGESPAVPQTGSPITAFHSGKVMDVFGASNADNTPIVQWTPHGGSNQQWRLLHFAHVGPFELVIIQTMGSRKVLDVMDGSTESGARLVQRSWVAETNQLWIAYPFGATGYSLLINLKSGKVADVARASLENGAEVIQWDWKGGLNQLWTVPAVVTPTTTTSTTGATTSTTSGATTTTTSGNTEKASPTLTSTADLFAQVGTPIKDDATLSGGNNPTGTITFRVYTEETCTSTPVFTDTVPVNGNGTYSSGPFTPTQEAAYIWVASYSGDANNNPVSTVCGDPEQVSLVVVPEG